MRTAKDWGQPCPDPRCSHYNRMHRGNIRSIAPYQTKSGKRRLFACRECQGRFSETRDTVFFDLRTPEQKVMLALKMLLVRVDLSSIAFVLDGSVAAAVLFGEASVVVVGVGDGAAGIGEVEEGGQGDTDEGALSDGVVGHGGEGGVGGSSAGRGIGEAGEEAAGVVGIGRDDELGGLGLEPAVGEVGIADVAVGSGERSQDNMANQAVINCNEKWQRPDGSPSFRDGSNNRPISVDRNSNRVDGLISVCRLCSFHVV